MPNSGFTIQIVMLIALIALMYFLLIRPQKKREKKVNEMRNSIKAGDEIITIGGIYGKIVKVRDDRLTIMVGTDKTKMEITRWAVSKIDSASAQKSSRPAREEREEEPVRKPKPKKMLKKVEEEPAQEPDAEPLLSIDTQETADIGDTTPAPAADPAEAAEEE